MDKSMNHTFAICAYKESPYLEDCIVSLIGQTTESKIIMATSTPNVYIDTLAKKYDIPLHINEGQGGITQDWNFALSCVDTKYATIAHQDDVYEADYTEKIIRNLEKVKNPIIGFSEYRELRNGQAVSDIPMLKIKRVMLAPLRVKWFWNSKWVRRRILSLGDPICCPAVTFCLENVERPVFQHNFYSCEDWEAWEKLSKLKGAFVYVPEYLMCHRIHEESATSEIIADNRRVEENYVMYCKFWPKWIAQLINQFYTKAEKSNQL